MLYKKYNNNNNNIFFTSIHQFIRLMVKYFFPFEISISLFSFAFVLFDFFPSLSFNSKFKLQTHIYIFKVVFNSIDKKIYIFTYATTSKMIYIYFFVTLLKKR